MPPATNNSSAPEAKKPGFFARLFGKKQENPVVAQPATTYTPPPQLSDTPAAPAPVVGNEFVAAAPAAAPVTPPPAAPVDATLAAEPSSPVAEPTAVAESAPVNETAADDTVVNTYTDGATSSEPAVESAPAANESPVVDTSTSSPTELSTSEPEQLVVSSEPSTPSYSVEHPSTPSETAPAVDSSAPVSPASSDFAVPNVPSDSEPQQPTQNPYA